jgi:hypothetical protein
VYRCIVELLYCCIIVACIQASVLPLLVIGWVQVLPADGALGRGGDRVEVLSAVDLVKGLSEDLIGALCEGGALSMVGPFRNAAVCVLYHHAGPVGHAGLIVARAVGRRCGLYGCFLGRVGSLRDHSRNDCLIQTIQCPGLGGRLSRLHLVGQGGVGLSQLTVARGYLASGSLHVRFRAP